MGSSIKRIAILGSTGSIGWQTLDVIRASAGRFKVIGLAGGNNLRLLQEQIEEFQPVLFYSSVEPDFACGAKFMPMEEMVGHPEVDTVVIATSGRAGLKPALAALQAGKTVALANKEVLVMAGGIVMQEAKRHQCQILPVDSEHSAIWQCLQGERVNKPRRIILTASGGPFYGYSRSQLSRVTAEQALHHPTWKMGEKVTIDSATLMNKGLEVVEAHWLFDVPFENIEIVVHPQSIVHSMVEFADGSVKAQLSFPDMRLPIQYAICYPERLPDLQLPPLNLSELRTLNFEPVCYDDFPCLKLALDAGGRGGPYPAALCAADEVAVNSFLSGEIGFLDIAPLIEETLEKHQCISNPSLDEILEADAKAREYAGQRLHHRAGNELEKG